MRMPGGARRVSAVIAAAVGFLVFAVPPALATHDHSKVKIQLSPESATNTVGTQHCVTARVRDTGHGNNDVAGATVRFSVSGANSASGSGVTGADGRTTFCYVGTRSGSDVITAFVDFNLNGTMDADEPSASASKTWTPGPPATLTLEPPTAQNTTGTQHCVTATVRDALGNPISNMRVVFSVSGANPSGPTTLTTNTSGQAQFCYTGTAAGGDTITAFADTNRNGSQNTGEPGGAATKVWTPPGPSTLTLSPAAAENPAGTQHCVTATARDAFGNPSVGVPIVFSVTGANSASGTVTTNASGQATFCYTGTQVGLDTITAFADTNRNGSQDLLEPFGVATKTYTPAAPATLTIMPPAAENTVGTQHCVMAEVRDAFGNPVPDVTVVFAVSGANFAGGSRTTDLNGQATFCYTGTGAGLDTISAFADTDGDGSQDTGEPTGAATKLYHPDAPDTLVLSPPTDTNEVGQEHCVTATVRDVFGNPTPNTSVVFTVTGANSASGAETTDANGQATFCYTGTVAGTDTISAFADTDGDGSQDLGEPSGTATKVYTPAAPAALVLTPPTATNEAGTQHCVTATVSDRFGNPTPGIVVRFSVTGANSASGAATTDANGQAQFCYTGTRAGTDTISAFADTNANGTQNTGEPGDTATKIYRPGPPAVLTLAPPTATNEAGTQHCVTATVTDRFGNPTPSVTVVFSVTGVNPRPAATRTTNTAGQTTFCYTGTRAGPDTISAFADTNGNGSQDAGEPSGTATKVYTPAAPATLVLTPPTDTNEAGEEHCVTATVQDVFGNPNPDVRVVFSVTGANTAGGTRITNADGQATFCYTGTVAGTDTISAFADTNRNGTQDTGEPSGTATKVYTPGPPAEVTLSPQSAENTVGEQHCVTATVSDRFGNPTPGIVVRFSVTGANSASGAATTDANGQAQFCYTGTRAGTDTISAFADTNANGMQDTGEPDDTATKTYKPGPPFAVTLSPAAAMNVVDSRHCVTATVRDRFGNPNPDVTVRFTVTGAVNTSGQATTDVNGQATFCYDGPPLPGEDLITAFADTDDDGTQDAGEPVGTATKTWVLPPSTPICTVEFSTYGGHITADNGDRGSFGGNAHVSETLVPSGEEQYRDHGPVAPMNVHSINVLAVVCTTIEGGRKAQIYGQARIDGAGSYFYRITVKDMGEAGTDDTYWILLSNGYSSGEHNLDGGNVQIH